MAIDLVLRGTIVPVTPIHISRPVIKGVTDRDGGAPHMSVVVGNGTIRVPYIPGESLKGMLRSRSADIASRASDQVRNLQLFLALYKGGIKGKEKDKTDDLKRVVDFRGSNPVLGLYGAAAPMWLAGSLSIQHAYPDDPDQASVDQSNGVRVDDLKRDPERLADVPQEMVDEYLAYVEAMRKRSVIRDEIDVLSGQQRKLIKKREKGEQVGDQIDVLEDKKKALKKQADDLDAMETIGRPLGVVKTIAVGSRLSHTIRVVRGSEAETGLLFETLRSLADLCRIGGLRSSGHGFFKADYSIMIREDEAGPFESAGSLSVAPETFSLDSDHPLVAGCIAAWQARAADPKSLHIDVKA